MLTPMMLFPRLTVSRKGILIGISSREGHADVVLVQSRSARRAAATAPAGWLPLLSTRTARHGMAFRPNNQPAAELPVKMVSVEGLVVLKMIKHSHEEGSDAQGVLMGLIRDSKMEVTNCFALPREAEEEDLDDADYQSVMIRHLRNANVDHLVVGGYQANPCGSAVAKRDTVDILQKQFLEQGLGSESVVLLYDPIRAQKGFLTLKAVRLTPVAEKLLRDSDSTPDPLRSSRISFDKFFEELPVKIRNSHLISALMCEVDEELRVDEGKQLLDMGSVSVLEKNLQSLMKCVEDVSKWANHQRQTTVKQQQIVKENAQRQAKGEPLLSEEEMHKILKQYNPIHRMEALLNSSQTLNYCQQTSSFASQNIGKLFMSKAMQLKDGK